jgi:serine/threonine protein kinase
MHRDIKPDNILLDGLNRPRICDLGMAKMTTPDGMTEMMGSPLFMAPEVLDSQSGEWGYSADVYAFAISCYQIAGIKGGWPPAGVHAFSQLKAKIIQGRRPDLKQFGKSGFGKLLERMWAQAPAQRPHFREVADELAKPENWLPQVNAKLFEEYVRWLKNEAIALPPTGLSACLERVKLSMTIVRRVPVKASRLERFAIVLSFICSDEADQQEEISQFIVKQLTENQSLSHIEAAGVSEAIIQDMELAENAEMDESVDDGEDIVEEEWVQPKGEIYHLRILRDGEGFAMEVTKAEEATVADLYRTLRGALGATVTISTAARTFEADSKELLTALNLKNLVLDVVVNPG